MRVRLYTTDPILVDTIEPPPGRGNIFLVCRPLFHVFVEECVVIKSRLIIPVLPPVFAHLGRRILPYDDELGL